MFPAETTKKHIDDDDEQKQAIVSNALEKGNEKEEKLADDKSFTERIDIQGTEKSEKGEFSERIPKVEIHDADDDDDVIADNDIINNENERITTRKESYKEKNMLENVEHFSNLIGEELVNSYWRQGFNVTAALTTAITATTITTTTTSNANATPLNANKIFPAPAQQQQQQQTKAVLNHPHQLQHMSLHTQPHFPHRFPSHPSHAHIILSQQQQQQQQHLQQQHGPSSTALLSQLVNSTFSNSTTHPSLLRTDALHHSQQQFQQQTGGNLDNDKMSSHHQNECSTSASTPNLSDISRAGDHDHLHGTHSLNGSMSSLSMSLSKFHEDNNNSLCATPNSQTGISGHPHLPSAFLPGLPFQFQERGHFRFADDLQLPPGSSMAGRLGESLIPKGDPMEAKLQEMLRYNMDKYANQALDTLHISRRVRELLSVHNIGQRLFAKYILGLSQGTVSELLSKPKPWDKLTEKGRDSYRKMHAWGCDDNAVMLLKSLIPKKGKCENKTLPFANSYLTTTTSVKTLFKNDKPNTPLM